MIILAFVQNINVKKPEKLARKLEEAERAVVVQELIFKRNEVGNRLKKAFGKKFCKDIIWESITERIGRISSSMQPPEDLYLATVLARWKPDLVLTFGNIATRNIQDFREKLDDTDWIFIPCIHPTARVENAEEQLAEIAKIVKALDKKHR